MDGLILRSPWPDRVRDAVFERLAVTLLAIGAFLPYFIVNRVTLNWPAIDLGGPVDAMIPFSPPWELVYVSIYFYIFVAVTWIHDAALFRRVALAFALMQFTCYAIYLAMPVGIERPAHLDLRGSFLEWGVALNWTIDQPRNLFPSLHLGNAFLVSLTLFHAERRIGAWALVWAGLIGYSTMAVRHHYFADVVAGVAVALFYDRLLVKPAVAEARGRVLLNPPIYAWSVIALYPLVLALLYLAWAAGLQWFDWPPT